MPREDISGILESKMPSLFGADRRSKAIRERKCERRALSRKEAIAAVRDARHLVAIQKRTPA